LRKRWRVGAWQQRVEQPVFRGIRGAIGDARHRVLALQLHGHVDEVAHDRVDVAADIADLGELRRLDLDERRVR
jgi:FXSXX-COOH protein